MAMDSIPTGAAPRIAIVTRDESVQLAAQELLASAFHTTLLDSGEQILPLRGRICSPESRSVVWKAEASSSCAASCTDSSRVTIAMRGAAPVGIESIAMESSERSRLRFCRDVAGYVSRRGRRKQT